MRVLVRPFPPTADRLAVPGGAVHVWQAWLDAPPVPAADLAAALTPDERGRAARFKVPRVGERFARGRGLLRVLLGRYLGRPPAAVTIGTAPDGKPVVAAGGVEFNVSHTGGLAVFAVGDRPVGVDVEEVRSMPTMDALVERFFAAAEQEQYRGLSAGLRAATFWRGWTCKEAVLKGIGCGTRDLDRCVVDLDPRRPPRVVGPPETAARWAVAAWEPAPGFVAAVAAAGDDELRLVWQGEPA